MSDPVMTRRDALAVAAALTLAATDAAHAQPATPPPAAAPGATAAVTARGVVFEDIDFSGVRTPASQGVPDVMVSNGRDVVKTAADGSWSLQVRPGDSIFVIKPSGWTTPVQPETLLPLFASLYAPRGSRADIDYRYPVIPPMGPMPASIDIPLHRQAESARFDAILFTDPQPESLNELGYIRDDVVTQAATQPAAFGICHGDLMFDDLSMYPRYNRIVASIGVPFYNCCGNHDINLEAPDNASSRETFRRTFGARQLAFQYGGATFFILDNVEYMGTDPSKPNGFGAYRGHFGPDQLGFVRAVLANVPRDSLVVYSFHIPLRTLQGTDPAVATIDTRDFLAAIGTHPNSFSFSGHTHTNEHWYFGAAEGFASGTHHHQVLAAVSGSWWSGPLDDRGIPAALQSDGCPNGFHIFSVDGGKAMTRFVPAHDPARAQLRVSLDGLVHADDPVVVRDNHAGALTGGPISRAAAGSTRVVVNLFDGGPKSRVELAVGRQNGFRPMQKVERTDPFVVDVYTRFASTKKAWVKPDRSTHVWQSWLPVDLAAGTHRLEVRATDEYGREHTGVMVLEVT